MIKSFTIPGSNPIHIDIGESKSYICQFNNGIMRDVISMDTKDLKIFKDILDEVFVK